MEKKRRNAHLLLYISHLRFFHVSFCFRTKARHSPNALAKKKNFASKASKNQSGRSDGNGNGQTFHRLRTPLFLQSCFFRSAMLSSLFQTTKGTKLLPPHCQFIIPNSKFRIRIKKTASKLKQGEKRMQPFSAAIRRGDSGNCQSPLLESLFL